MLELAPGRNGLLFLETDEVQRVTDELAAAQPLIAALAADPSVNGLFGAFNLALRRRPAPAAA